MGEFQIVGDQESLSKKVTQPPTTAAHSGAFQIVGDQEKLDRKSTAPPTTEKHSGVMQIVGDFVPLSSKQTKGWGSAANLPMAQYPGDNTSVNPSVGRKK
jgi:hypothetical protein